MNNIGLGRSRSRRAIQLLAGVLLCGVSAAALAVVPPALTTSFTPPTVPVGGATTLNFSITNADPGTALTGVAFSNTLPAGLTVPNASAGICGGTVTLSGGNNISLTGATIAPSSACSFGVTVTGTAQGHYTNLTTVTTTNAGSSNTSSAILDVLGPPTLATSFFPTPIAFNQTTGLQFIITNPGTNGADLTGVSFTDILPAGLSVPNASATLCGGGTVTLSGGNTISLVNADIAPGQSCNFTVTVTGGAIGTFINSTLVTTNDSGSSNTSNATLTVNPAPPVIIKAFGAVGVPLNGSTSLTFTINNINPAAATLTGIAFTDTLPAGLVVSTPNGLSGTCGGGTITGVAGSSSVSLSGASLAAGTGCTFSVNVTGTSVGTKNNTTGNVTSIEGGTGGTASASLSVLGPPTMTTAFNPTSIAVNATTGLQFIITNPATNGAALTGVGFTDTLPAGLTVPNASATLCGGGTVTLTAPSTITLVGSSIAPGQTCNFTVTVTGTVLGNFTNTTGAVTSTNGGTGNTSSANLVVANQPPVIIKAFGAASIPLNGTTSLTFTLQSNNPSTALTGVAFTDTFPSGLVVATPNGLTGTCGAGTITAAAGSSSVSLAGGNLATNGSCTFAVNVTGTTAGAKTNTTGNVTATESGAGGTATAFASVVAPPTIAKSFGPTSIVTGATSTLTLTLTNPAGNSVALAGVAVNDAFPVGLTVAATPGLANTCGGTATATAGGTSLALSGASIAVGASCTVAVSVTAANGVFVNTTGVVSSTNGGTGTTATAALSVLPGAGGIPQVPTLSDAMLALMALLLATLGAWHVRRARTRGGPS
jgi:uncharacterized repeat protein (TIGR01451 family)